MLAGLALAILMRSSELELGAAGRERALQLRDAAQTAAEASWNAQVVDLGLAEAAMVITAQFLPCPFPPHPALLAISFFPNFRP